MDTNVKEQMIMSVDAIKHKLKQMKNLEDQNDLTMNRMLKPVVEPLKALIKSSCSTIENDMPVNKKDSFGNDSTSTIYEDLDNIEEDKDNDDLSSDGGSSDSDTFHSIESKSELLDKSLRKEDIGKIFESINIPFGIRSENKNLFMGNTPVTFSCIDNLATKDTMYMVTIGNKQYEFSPGLRELLLRKKPNLALVSEKDKLVYKDMLHHTNAHKRGNKCDGQLKGNKSVKYRDIIKPLFIDPTYNSGKEDSLKNVTKLGGGLPKMKKYTQNTDLVYWDDPNELIERLKLLVASKNAGNSNHDNEIISIIEELKEAGIIKE